jgi:hypothetical protein
VGRHIDRVLLLAVRWRLARDPAVADRVVHLLAENIVRRDDQKSARAEKILKFRVR